MWALVIITIIYGHSASGTTTIINNFHSEKSCNIAGEKIKVHNPNPIWIAARRIDYTCVIIE